MAENGHRSLEEALECIREVAAAEILREGVIYKSFDSWNCEQLRNAEWE
jgi:hypothetical protein